MLQAFKTRAEDGAYLASMRMARITLFTVVLLGITAFGQSQDGKNDPVGLWGTESRFGPLVRGELTLERTRSSWTIRVAGLEFSVPRSGDDVRATFPGGQGELRAKIEDGGQRIRGFWIQPRGNLGQFASPIVLARVRDGAWRGTVTPLDDQFSLYLRITRQEDGSLRGSFLNPEVNWYGRAPWFRVTEKDERLLFTDPSTGKTPFSQPYDRGQRRIDMDFGAPIALTPHTPENAVGYLPRTPAMTYVYRTPLPGHDGWRVARAGEVDVDEERLRAFVGKILSFDPALHDSPRIHSLLVARRGKLILDEYFFGFTADRPHDLRSASKTFTSVLAGIVMDRNRSLRLDTPIDQTRGITLAHLLTHSSGLACDDNDPASPGNEDTMQEQQEQRDWYRYFLDLPVTAKPGTKYAYCSAGINFAAGMTAKAASMELSELFDRFLARPLQMQHYHLNLMPNGEAYGAGGIYMRPRDFLKVGQAYLDGGVWNGRRIVSKSWVSQSTAHQIDVPGNGSDGYGWHRHTLTAVGRTFESYEASGNGGQFLIVVPKLELVVVLTAGNYGQFPVWRTFRDELVPEYVLAACMDADQGR